MKTPDSTCITHMPVPLIILDDHLNLVAASRPAYLLFKIRHRAQAPEENRAELEDVLLNDTEFVQAVGEATLPLTNPGSTTSLRWKKCDQIYDIEIGTMPCGGDRLCYGLHFQNITKRLAIEHSREITRNYLEQIIDSLPLGIVVTDREMRITAINRAQQELMERQGKERSHLSAIGSFLQEYLPPHAGLPWDRVKSRLFKECRAIEKIEHSINSNDATYTFSSCVRPLLKEDGEVIGAMHLTEDITDKLKLMAEAREADVLAARLETLQNTVVALNHIINNKLMGLMCKLEVIRSTGTPLPPEKLDQLDKAQDEADNIAHFIRNLSSIKEIKFTNYLNDEQMLDVSDIDGLTAT